MKPRMMSKAAMDQLFFHILDGFKSSHEGIHQLFDKGIINAQEKTELLQKNCERLISRVNEFKVGQKLLCIFFAALFGWMQITSDDQEMVRTGRTRASRSTRGQQGRRGKRKGENEDADLSELLIF
jgi:hypothetical protein